MNAFDVCALLGMALLAVCFVVSLFHRGDKESDPIEGAIREVGEIIATSKDIDLITMADMARDLCSAGGNPDCVHCDKQAHSHGCVACTITRYHNKAAKRYHDALAVKAAGAVLTEYEQGETK
jgi:hypothetical protein